MMKLYEEKVAKRFSQPVNPLDVQSALVLGIQSSQSSDEVFQDAESIPSIPISDSMPNLPDLVCDIPPISSNSRIQSNAPTLNFLMNQSSDRNLDEKDVFAEYSDGTGTDHSDVAPNANVALEKRLRDVSWIIRIRTGKLDILLD